MWADRHGRLERRLVALGHVAIRGDLDNGGRLLGVRGQCRRAAPLVRGSHHSSINPPHNSDVVIIGGGIIGVSTAYFLAKEGVKVCLCEKGFISGEQSGRNWGYVRVQGRDEREIPMMLESLNIWRNFNSELGEETGFEQGGCRSRRWARKFSKQIVSVLLTIITTSKLINIGEQDC